MNSAASVEHRVFASSAHSLARVTRVVGAVLAAGSGSRMGAPKAELRVDGVRLVDRAVTVLRDAGCRDIVAIVRPGVAVPGARVVVNADPERGMRSSLALAVAAVDRDLDALAVLLVDTPYGGRRGHPTVMSAQLWRDALAMAAADEGARAFLASRSDLVDEVPVDGDPTDLDTPNDLAQWGG